MQFRESCRLCSLLSSFGAPCRYRAVDARTRDWQTVSVTSSDLLSLTVYRLNPATLYQFMVAARSLDTGVVLFSKPVNATTTGNHRHLSPPVGGK